MKRVILFSVFFLILISNISASFEVGNISHFITNTYGANENIRGWINMSFENEPVDGLFKDSEDNSITLIKLLESDFGLIKDQDYFCSPVDCGVNYISSNGEETKEIELNEDEVEFVGFKFNENISSINSVSFNLSSDASSSCENQLEIDFLSDEIIELRNTKSYDEEVCELLKKYGCFKEEKADTNFRLQKGSIGKFCQRIKLTESPGFRLGAEINPQGDEVEVIFEIHEADSGDPDEALVSCATDISGNVKKEFYCNVDYLVTKSKEYYICIYADDDTIAEIEGYSDNEEGCGFYYTGLSKPETIAFNIFSIGNRFDNFNTLEIQDELPNEESLAEMFDEEIFERTNGKCSTSNPCIIPIKLISKKDQTITIDSIDIEYEIEDGPPVIMRKIYDLDKTSAIVDSNDFIEISLNNANLSVPGQQGGFMYALEYKGENVFTNENITIQAIPIITSLTPTSTVNIFPTELKVFVDKVGNDSITTYDWDIDGITSTTSENRKIYTFDIVKNYPVTITVTDIKGRASSKTFNIEVGSYIIVLGDKINESAENLAYITSQIENMSQFEEDSLKNVLDLQTLNDELISVQQLKTASDYEGAASKLLQLNIPKSVERGISTGLVSFYPNKNNIRPDIINAFQGGIYDASKNDKYTDSIATWHTANLDTKVKYSQIQADYPDGTTETILNVFEFKATQLNSLNESSYIFLKEMENLRFQQNYSSTTQQGYIQIPFDTSTKTIKFATTEEIDFLDIPIFISPGLDDLTLLEIEPEEPIGMKWALFFLFVVLLLIVGFIVYIILQHWYKTKYETYLFKDRNYLFNLITYIQDSKKKGMKDSEMIKKLKKAGWNSEQITYVMKKYAGKRTGMIEIPVEKVLSKFKKEKTYAPRQKPGMPAPKPAPGLQPHGKPQPKRFFKNSQ